MRRALVLVLARQLLPNSRELVRQLQLQQMPEAAAKARYLQQRTVVKLVALHTSLSADRPGARQGSAAASSSSSSSNTGIETFQRVGWRGEERGAGWRAKLFLFLVHVLFLPLSKYAY